jgi:hypothetical protein
MHARPGLLDEAQEPACAAGNVEQPHLALVAACHMFAERHQALAAHGVGAAGKQHLDLGVVELGGMLAQIAVGLVVEVLQEIVRQLLSQLRRIDLMAAAVGLALHRVRQVGEIAPARRPDLAETPVVIARHRIVAGLGVGEVALEQPRHVGQDAVAAGPGRARPGPWRLDGLRSVVGTMVAARGEVVAHVPGDAGALPGGVEELIDGCQHGSIDRRLVRRYQGLWAAIRNS